MTRTRGLGAKHQERRAQIADALLRIIDAEGLEAVNLRQVARQAGVSMGAVQHYFRTKDEMLLFALDYVSERGGERIRARLESDSPHRVVLREVLAEFIPADDTRRAELRVSTAFLARGLVDDRVTEHVRQGYAGIHGLLTLLVRRASGAVDPEQTAVTLFALAEGLGDQVLVGHLDATAALAVLDAQLERMVAGPPRDAYAE
ncbi:TetR/AcrR family transcriptional regulator [Amycolatopsis suaedae]|uniref:TetR/AcrR family transcriptional regulator n=1 Tax=Amycolatopsis suaedae TaxID=2510978 RepID=UPI0013EF027A|nr:TetR/AcrR family transcriptional regulator [Amycolatopsis suaedae]